MVPKLDQRRRNASKLRIPPRRSVAINSGNKAVAGPFMRQKEGQEFRQITDAGKGDRSQAKWRQVQQVQQEEKPSDEQGWRVGRRN